MLTTHVAMWVQRPLKYEALILLVALLTITVFWEEVTMTLLEINLKRIQNIQYSTGGTRF